MIVKYILWALLVYFLYKFVFEFIIPVARATKQIKTKVSDFHNQMQQQPPIPERPPSFKKTPTSNTNSKDYIDFEEVK
ncbi:MAG: hypothetical protein ACKVOW_05895 [Chitinophagaceae bacterium]